MPAAPPWEPAQPFTAPFAGEPPAAAPRAVAPPADAALADRWAALVAELDRQQAIAALTRELALQADLVGVDESVSPPCWRLRVAREALRAAPPREKLQAALAEHLGQALRLEVEAGTALDSPALREAAERERRQHEAEQTIQQDPLVRELLSQYPTARIVPGSIKPI